jgi:signal peptidase I
MKNITSNIKNISMEFAIATYIEVGILLMILAPIAVFTLVASRTDALFSIRSFVVISGSMSPTYPVGSLIYTKKATYDVGDIIAFKNAEDQTVTHRIVEKVRQGNDTLFKTKGDANKVTDQELVHSGRIIGKSYVSVPKIGYFMSFLKTPPGFIGLVIIPTLIFIAVELISIYKEIARVSEEKAMRKYAPFQNIPTIS